MRKVFLLVSCLALSGIAQATPIALSYDVTDIGGGLFDYEFSLELDNNDGSWSAGQGWRWFIFGDAELDDSPLTDFIGDLTDLPVGAWTYYSFSGGGHNGPTFGSVLDYWVPTAVGETLQWSGTSTADLGQGELLFSTLAGTLGGAVAADFEVATRVPEPGTIALLGIGLLGMGLARRRKI